MGHGLSVGLNGSNDLWVGFVSPFLGTISWLSR